MITLGRLQSSRITCEMKFQGVAAVRGGVAAAAVGEFQKNKTSPDGAGSCRADRTKNWFMRSCIGNAAVAPTREGHRRPRLVLGVRPPRWDPVQLSGFQIEFAIRHPGQL
jgi:hypothetical protein